MVIMILVKHRIFVGWTGDRTHKTFIAIEQIELDKLLNVKQSKTNSSKVAIEKNLGFQLNMKTTSVTEYYDYIEEIKQDNGRG